MATRPRLTMYFKQGNFGWTETHFYVPPVSGAGGLTTVVNEGVNLAAKRAQLLGNGVILGHIRASYDDTWRDSVPKPGPVRNQVVDPNGVLQPLPYYNPNAKALPADEPYSVTTMLLSMGESYRKLIYLSGLPQAIQPNPPLPVWPGWFVNVWNAYGSYLTGYNLSTGQTNPAAQFWGSVVRSKGNDSIVSAQIISSAATDPHMIYTTSAAHGLVYGNKIRILGVKQDPNQPRTRINGTFRVALVPTATTFGVTTDIAPSLINIIGFDGATVERIDPKVIAYTDWNWENQTHRKRGVPFGSPRGRSKRPARKSV